MSTKYLLIALALLSGVIAINQTHEFLLFDAWIDAGGTFNKVNNECIYERPEDKQNIVLNWFLVVLYLIVGAVVAFSVWFASNKFVGLIHKLSTKT
jgi:hypothetical protein